jgi:hypothetical protein
MSWNNTIPAWMLNSEVREAIQKFEKNEITKQDVYNKIKDITEVPDHVKENWEPDNDE